MASPTALAVPTADDLLTTSEAAAYLRISPSTLERYRLTGTPAIPFIKFGGKRGRVLYRRSVLDALLAQSVRLSTSDDDR